MTALAPYYSDECVTLYHGDNRDVVRELALSAEAEGREFIADHAIDDPPYSDRTHGGQRHGRRDAAYEKGAGDAGWVSARGLDYAALSPGDVRAFVTMLSPYIRGWQCHMTDSELVPAYRDAFRACNLTDFKPIHVVLKGMNVRLQGDGPSSWGVYMPVAAACVAEPYEHDALGLMVARPKNLSRWGTLPGAYIGNPFDPGRNTRSRKESVVVGSKPVWLMQNIIRDYSRKGETVLDAFAGGCSTGVAARREGRRAILIEAREEICEAAAKRLERESKQMDLF